MRRRTRTALAATAGLTLLPGAALAQTSEQQGAPATRETPTPGEAGTEAQGTGLWERSDLFGDMGGLRPALGRIGASLGLTETSEILGNPTGGSKTGAVYEGTTEMSLGIDLSKAVGLQGGLFNASAWQIHGRGLSTNNIDNLMVVSSVEADRATRLFELWYQQSFLEGKLDVRLGQLAADQEFIISQYAGLFINSSFGWPTLPSVDLPAGGPAYPLATPGVRVRVLPNEETTLLLGAFNGNPAANANFPPSDPQLRNPSGANIRFQGTFVIGEVQYAVNQGEGAKGPPATFKLGAWYSSNAFTDQFFAAGAETAAGPGVIPPGQHRGDWSVYAVVDQLVWRPPGAREGGGMGVFLRAMGAPANRNQIVAFVDGGVTLKGPFGRADDSVGLGFGWARISGVTISGEHALVAAGGQVPVQSAETVVE
ncbi:MAG: carbohydrate porin, partial [Acetobacteraceae bacterium]|nr:carbohydrate porin [Acetobacteraceae bacterium]